MRTRVRSLLVVLLATAIGLLFQLATSPEPAHLQSGAVIQPAVLEALQVDPEASVTIHLVPPTISPELTSADMKQTVAQRQADVLADLTAADFILTRQYEFAPALSGRITASGVEKLDGHPSVARVAINARMFTRLNESRPLIHADEVYSAGFDGSGVDVAVLDTGIRPSHPDLEDSIIGQECYLFLWPCPDNPNYGSNYDPASRPRR